MSKEAKLGLFVISVFAVFLFFTVNMGSGLLAGPKKSYPVYFTNIGTLDKGAPVKQAGLNVGEVSSIAMKTIMEPTPTHYIVATISVDDKALIAYDSKASILTMGMMGEQYIELSFGKLELAPEGTRITGQGTRQLDQIMAAASEAMTEITKLIVSLNLIFSDDGFQLNITHLIANLEQFSRDVNELLGGQEERLKKILENTQIASANLTSLIASAELFVTDARGLINENRPHIRKTLENTSEITQTLKEKLPQQLDDISGQLTSLSNELKNSVQNANQLIAKFDTVIEETRPDIRDTMSQIKDFSTNAKQASERINHLITQIDEGDGLVSKLIHDPLLSNSVIQAVTQVSGVLNEASGFGSRFSFEIDSRYYPDHPRFDSHDNNMRVDMGMKYALSDYWSVYLGGNSLGSANDFEGQVGYKLGAFTLHGGMIESEVGLGVDWQIFDRWMIGLEGVGLTDDGGERLDAYTEFLIWKQMYLVGGVQDITDQLYPSVGLKWRF